MKKQIILAGLLAWMGTANAQSTWGGSTSQTGSAYRTGYVGIGTTSPADQLDVLASNTNGGVTITQNTYGSSAVTLNNTTTGGRKFVIGSTGVGNAQGAGHYSIYDYNSAADRFFIQGGTGNTGIGTISVNNDRLRVLSQTFSGTQSSEQTAARFEISSAYYGTYTGVHAVVQDDYTTTGAAFTGVWGEVTGNANHWGQHRGVTGIASDGVWNHGGYFEATSTSNSSNWSSAIVGQANQPSGAGTCWAGYFNGGVYSTTGYTTSDKKFKTDIKSMNNMMEKVKQLKPSTYVFKTGEEFSKMSLPKGKQLGLIAQELEQVFPELITEIAAQTKTNDKGEKVIINESFKAVNYTGLIPVLIAAVQEQQVQIDEQKQIIESLQKKLTPTGLQPINPADDGFKMEQNEPNPFTQETVIKYYLPAQTNNAVIAVYDLSGKQLTAIPINDKSSSSITISAEKLSAGIYLYSIIADGKVMDTKRMVVTQK